MKIKMYIFVFILLSILIFSLYGNTFKNEFVYDDDMLVVKNEFIKSFSNLKFLISNEYFHRASELSYRPLQTLTYFIDFKLWGLDKIYGWHLFNISLHLINSFLIFILVTQLFKNYFLSFLSSLFFAVHPACTEAVTGITYREDPLAALFFLISFIYYVKWRESKHCKEFVLDGNLNKFPSVKNNIFFIFISASGFLLSLLSKESTLILPLILLLWEYKMNSNNPSLLYISWHWLILIFYMVLRFKIFVSPEEVAVERLGGSFLKTLIIAPSLMLKYLFLTFLPANLCPDYVINVPSIEFSIITGIVFILIFVGVIGGSGNFKVLSLTFLFFFISFFPVLNLIPIANPFAIRYMYLPMIFGSILIAYSLLKIPTFIVGKIVEQNQSAKDIATFSLMIIVFIGFSLHTIRMNRIWKDDLTLWKYTLKCEPCSSRAYNNIGSEYVKQGRIKEAIIMFKKALKCNPKNWKIYNNLGIAYAKLGDGRNEIRSFKLAILRSMCYNPYYNLAVSYEAKGERKKAEIFYRKAIEFNPKCEKCFLNLAYLYKDMGNIKKSNLMYKKVVELQQSK